MLQIRNTARPLLQQCSRLTQTTLIQPSLIHTRTLTQTAITLATPSPATPTTSAASQKWEMSDQVTVKFPKSQAYLDRLEAARLKANPPPVIKKPRTHAPRSFARRDPNKVPLPIATPPTRLEGDVVPWKVTRSADGSLPLHLKKARMETSKAYLMLDGISGDIKSLVSEIQLFVGPFYVVKANDVDTRIEIVSTPKTQVNERFIQKLKEWFIKIGV